MTLRVLAGGRARSSSRPGLLVTGAAEITTFAGGIRRGPAQDEAAALTGGRPEIAVFDGRIVAVGTHDDVQRRLAAEGLTDERRFTTLDARGGTVTPGLIDPHTHLLFAGTREAELRLRQRGAGYLEVLAAGGGILATVARTREASEDELADHGRHWLDQMLTRGVTTVEAKSGYGLDRATVKLISAEKLGKFTKPKYITFAPGLPKTRSGKIMRRLLRDIAEGRTLGDTTTLADSAVVAELQTRAKDESTKEE